jgi:hypothetical protein
MSLKGSNNLNDFMSQNNLIGTNVYISPMNNDDFNSSNSNYMSKKSTRSKNIESYFYPMMNVI